MKVNLYHFTILDKPLVVFRERRLDRNLMSSKWGGARTKYLVWRGSARRIDHLYIGRSIHRKLWR